MRILRGALAWLLLAGSSCAFAHAHLTHSSPAAGAHLSTAPRVLELYFSEAAQLTALWIEKAGSAKQKLGPLPAKSADHISVALPGLGPGEYLVSWRVLGSDGHLSPGQLRFAVGG
jgi:methionine-rich copper-binding protein CopC